MLKFVYQKFVQPIIGVLRQGITPKQLAITVALGFLLGVFPFPGITTGLCAGVAILFRLNMVAIQMANYVVYPLQFFLFIPYVTLGKQILGSKIEIGSFEQFSKMVMSNLFQLFDQFITILLDGVIGWAIGFIPIFIMLYIILFRTLIYINQRLTTKSNHST